MQQTTLALNYLGCPLHIGKAKASFFNGLVHKFETRLQGWYAKLLSPGGRIILTKHVLSSLPINLMAAIQLPVAVMKKIERIMVHIIWNDSQEHRHRIWKSWEALCYPLDENGLGFRDLKQVQKSFSCKLWWKLRNQQGLWASKFMNSDYPLYKLHAWKLLATGQQCIDDNTKYLGEPFQQWVWTPVASGLFTVASAYQQLRHKKLTRFELGEIWKPYIPTKVSFFLWRLYNKLLPFPEQLMRMNIHGPYKCPFCSQMDSYIHAFWGCSNAQKIWEGIQALINFKAPRKSWGDFMHGWVLNGDRGALGKVKRVIFYFSLWEIWKQRTSLIYGESLISPQQVTKRVLSNIQKAGKLMNLNCTHEDDRILVQRNIITQLRKDKVNKITLVQWHPPQGLDIKLNCDGSSLGNPGPAGGGFIARDSNGKVVMAGYESYGHCTNMEVEIRAMMAGLTECVRLGFHQVIVETDSEILFKMLTHSASISWKYKWEIHTLQQLFLEHNV